MSKNKRLSYAELQQIANQNQAERARQLQAQEECKAKAAADREERIKQEKATRQVIRKKPGVHRPSYAELQEQAKRNAAQKDVRVRWSAVC